MRRERPHPGAQLSFTDADGHRFQVFLTDSPDSDLAYLEARHRGHARVEDRIKDGKDLGLERFPHWCFAHNQAWLIVVLIACDLLAWTKGLCLDGEFAVASPKRLRYCLLHTAATVVRHARQLTMRLQANWPWTTDLQYSRGRPRRWRRVDLSFRARALASGFMSRSDGASAKR